MNKEEKEFIKNWIKQNEVSIKNNECLIKNCNDEILKAELRIDFLEQFLSNSKNVL